MNTKTRPSTFKKRLLKLADFLENLPPGRFDYYRIINSLGKLEEIPQKQWDAKIAEIDSNPVKQRSCGYLGCAVGWLPFAFPRDFKLSRSNSNYDGRVTSVVLRNGSGWRSNGRMNDASKFFGLTPAERDHLFQPGDQLPETFGGVKLNGDASPKAVAKNIRAFVAKKY